MKEIIGKYNQAKIFTDVIDNASIEQIKTLCNQSFVKDSKIRIMPDVHAGAGCTIGTTMTIKDKIIPNLVGVDIGCGMEVLELEDTSIDLEAFDKLIYEKIPSGMDIREKPHPYLTEINLEELKCNHIVWHHRVERSIGTLGGGNHFIEIDKDDDGKLYLVIHSGSRHLGKEVAEHYQEEAYKQVSQNAGERIEHLIQTLKEQGRTNEIEKTVAKYKQGEINIPKALAYVSDELFDNYIHDMKIVQKYALLNRKAMADELIKGLGLTVKNEFTTIHNYIDTDAMILRKGAVSAKLNEKFLIPINMRDGSLICLGKGNEDWNFSAPHGAGRLFSRNKAKNNFTIEAFQSAMNGIYTSSINENTLDECPMAYKNMADIVNNISPTAEILKIIKPIYNFKAGEAA